MVLTVHLRLFPNHPTTTQWGSFDVVTKEFYFIPITQELFQTKLNAMLQLGGKIPILFSAGQVIIKFARIGAILVSFLNFAIEACRFYLNHSVKLPYAND